MVSVQAVGSPESVVRRRATLRAGSASRKKRKKKREGKKRCEECQPIERLVWQTLQNGGPTVTSLFSGGTERQALHSPVRVCWRAQLRVRRACACHLMRQVGVSTALLQDLRFHRMLLAMQGLARYHPGINSERLHRLGHLIGHPHRHRQCH